jgi:hypothetical protein
VDNGNLARAPGKSKTAARSQEEGLRAAGTVAGRQQPPRAKAVELNLFGSEEVPTVMALGGWEQTTRTSLARQLAAR